MGLFNNIRKAVPSAFKRTPKRKESSSSIISPWMITAATANKDMRLNWNIYYDAMNHEVVSACISAIIMEVLGVGFNIGVDNENETPNQGNIDYITNLFQYPGGSDNINDTYTNFFWKCWTSLLGTGDVFVEVAYNEFNDKLPAGMYFIPPHYMIYDKEVDQWGYSNSDVRFEPEELIHIKYPDMLSSTWGKSPINSISRSLTMDFLSWRFNLDFFKGGMHPQGIFNYDPEKINPDQFMADVERIRASRKANPRGSLFLYGGNYQDITMSNREMEFSLMQDKIRDRILGVYGVPPHKIGIIESGNLGGGTGEEQAKNFWKKRKGEIKLFEDGFNNVLGLKSGWIEKWRVGEVDLENKLLRAQIEDIRVKNYTQTINEIRHGYNEERVEWGDSPFLPQNFITPAGNPELAGVKRYLTSKGLIKP